MIRHTFKKIRLALPLILVIAVLILIYLFSLHLSLSGRYFLPPVGGWRSNPTSQDTFISLHNRNSYFELNKISKTANFESTCQQLYDSEKGTNKSFGSTTFRGRQGYKCAFDQKDNLISYFFIPGPDFYYQLILKYPKSDPDQITQINDLVNELVLF